MEKVDNFHMGGHFVFQNKANFSRREAYLPMKISGKFGEPSWPCFPRRALISKISPCVWQRSAKVAGVYNEMHESIFKLLHTQVKTYGGMTDVIPVYLRLSSYYIIIQEDQKHGQNLSQKS